MNSLAPSSSGRILETGRRCSVRLGPSLSIRGHQTQNPSGLNCQANSANKTSASSQPIASYPYNDSDGYGQKATIEHVFGAMDMGADDDAAESIASEPWSFGWQMNERNIMWNDDLKLRLIKQIACDQLGVSGEEMEWRLGQLVLVLPGLQQRLVNAPPTLVARLAAQTDAVAQRMLALKLIFPAADTSTMVSNRLSLLLDDDLDEIRDAAARLRVLLPGLKVDKFVELFPIALDVDNFEMAIEDAARMLPGMDVVDMLRRQPDTILSLVKGKNLIPYDAISNPWS